MNIRPATEKDLSAILEIFNYEIIHTSYVYVYEPWTMDYITEWFRKKQKSNFPFLVAENENDVVGYGYYTKFREREAYDTTVEYSVYIEKANRGKGIAYKIVSKLIEIAKEQGIYTFIGGVDSENYDSIRFHKRMGFTQVAHIKSVAQKFNKWLDLFFFQLLLNEG